MSDRLYSISFLLVIFISFFFASCGKIQKENISDSDSLVKLNPELYKDIPSKKLVFIPHWSPQAQFAGYYAAYENGFYRKYGIDLVILNGGPNNKASDVMEKNNADVASLWLTNALQLIEKKIDLINIAQILPKSALMLVAKKSSGVSKIEDLNNSKVGIWGGDYIIQPMALFKKYNVNITLVPQLGSINLFLLNGVKATTAMWYNEYNTIINSGLNPDELTTFFYYDYDLNFPEEGIYCFREKFLADSVSYVYFVKATFEGWQWSFLNPEKTLLIVKEKMKSANLPYNYPHQKWMLEKFNEMIFHHGKNENAGLLDEKDYYKVVEEMKKENYIKTAPEFKNFFVRTYYYNTQP